MKKYTVMHCIHAYIYVCLYLYIYIYVYVVPLFMLFVKGCRFKSYTVAVHSRHPTVYTMAIPPHMALPHTYVHTHIHVSMFICQSICLHVCTCVCLHVCMYACIKHTYNTHTQNCYICVHYQVVSPLFFNQNVDYHQNCNYCRSYQYSDDKYD